MIERHLVMYVEDFNFNDRETGRPISGIKVKFLGNERVDGQNKRGIPVLKVSGAINLLHQFTEVPGYYDLNMALVSGKNDVPQLELHGVKFVAPAPSAAVGEQQKAKA